ncbi:hypothetical protein PoB_003770000 [Plakobranchus ocellatus]|uniref:Uncharacterized protein n=1 Tax=Plakobranchus ocellatus TaxID=259542 RepID=A0AAV4AV94_9GAST|nr:hypothetical protein PoB_003770000 [Plakobranchus ocellatus]
MTPRIFLGSLLPRSTSGTGRTTLSSCSPTRRSTRTSFQHPSCLQSFCIGCFTPSSFDFFDALCNSVVFIRGNRTVRVREMTCALLILQNKQDFKDHSPVVLPRGRKVLWVYQGLQQSLADLPHCHQCRVLIFFHVRLGAEHGLLHHVMVFNFA